MRHAFFLIGNFFNFYIYIFNRRKIYNIKYHLIVFLGECVNMSIRTDLALEAHEVCKEEAEKEAEIDGVDVDIQKDGSITITKIKITNSNGVDALGKPIGQYITIESPNLKYSVSDYEKTCEKIAETLCGLIGEQDDAPILIAGLGNTEITPDALGPVVMSKLIITRHMKKHMGDYFGSDFSNVCAIAPGVLGTTGIETASVIKGVVCEIKPSVIIAVDALAARSVDRISTTIQISDTGIQPGAGVGNRRDSLDEHTLGIKVISVGVPTVVDAATIARDSLDAALEEMGRNSFSDGEKENIIESSLSKNISGLVVTPKDIDLVIERAAKTVANGINLAVHKNLTFDDIESFVG